MLIPMRRARRMRLDVAPMWLGAISWAILVLTSRVLAADPASAGTAATFAATATAASPDATLLAEVSAMMGMPVEQPPALAARSVGPATLRLIDVSLGLLAAVGGSSAAPPDIAVLQGGGHDPNRNGFTIQNLELAMSGAVDPYFTAQANIVFLLDPEGESVVELEEAFARTTRLPAGLEFKGGAFFTEFGRHNPQHPHQWAFVDQPVILSRLLGPDGLRGPGARISLLLPFRWYSEVLGGAQNANGETAVSFLGAGDAEPIAGYEAVGRETDSIDDMLYTTRWLNSWSISDTLTLNLGASGAFGPNASGDRNRTRIAGADVYALWKPVVNRRGWPFVRLQAEVLQRWYQAGDGTPRKTLIDRGAYTQIVWGFFERWAAGLRWDGARGFGGLVAPNADPLRDARQRLSPNLSFYPTEFSKLRLQYNRDWAQATADAHSVWLQIEVAIGAHGAHQF